MAHCGLGSSEVDLQVPAAACAGGDTGIMLIHMGLHMLEGLPGIVQLYQLAVPGLEERARVLPAMQTREQLGAGCAAADDHD